MSDESSSDLFLAPEQRLPVACDRCRKRKQRCDRRVPSCRRCVAAGVQCISTAVAASDNGSGINADGSRVGYVEQLEARLKALEQAAHEQTAREQPRSSSRSVPDINSPLAHLTLAAMAEEREVHNSAYSFNMASVISATAAQNGSMLTGPPPELPSFTSIFGQAVSTDIRTIVAGIPRDQSSSFIDSYFETVHVVFPWSTRGCLHEMHARVVDPDGPPFHRLEALLVAASIALGMGAMGRRHEADFLAHCISRNASSLFSSTSSDDNRLLGIQGTLLLAVLSLFHPEAGLTWHYVGLGVNRIISCGFHRESTSAGSYPPSQQELSRQREAFWAMYSLDRITSLALGKPVSIQNCDITAMIPSTNNASKDCKDALLLTKLLSEITRARGSNSSHYYQRLRAWKSMADLCISSTEQSYSMQYFELLYLRGLILLFETHPSRDQIGSASAFEVMNAGAHLINVAHAWTLQGSPLCWATGHFVFAGAIAHLDVVIRDCYARAQLSLSDIMETFSKCSSTLGSYAQRYVGLKSHSDIYSDLASRASRFLERSSTLASLSSFSFNKLPGPLMDDVASTPSIRRITEEIHAFLEDNERDRAPNAGKSRAATMAPGMPALGYSG